MNFMIVWLFLVPTFKNLVVCVFDPTNHVLLSLLDASQEYKKCNKFGNVVNACSNNVDESIQIYKIFTH